jgi:hypothetical protein
MREPPGGDSAAPFLLRRCCRLAAPEIENLPGGVRLGGSRSTLGLGGCPGARSAYHLATPNLAALARREHIYLDQRFSDRAPLTIEYELSL